MVVIKFKGSHLYKQKFQTNSFFIFYLVQNTILFTTVPKKVGVAGLLFKLQLIPVTVNNQCPFKLSIRKQWDPYKSVL